MTVEPAHDPTRPTPVDALGLLDDEASSRLFRITALAARAFDLPFAAITHFVGEDARFAAEVGLPEGLVLPRREVFCHQTQATDSFHVVEDASREPEYARWQVVRDGTVKFYAGQPLHDQQGNVVASFCVFGPEARELSEPERLLFEELAGLAQEELVASTEMRLAGAAQQLLLPERGVVSDHWRIDGLCVPSLAVGGDFYDFGVDGDRAFLRLGDVMGKGTPAALIGAGVRAALRGTREAVNAGVDLGVTVTRTTRGLQDDFDRSASFVTLFEGALDLTDGRLRWVDAGCGLAVLVRADGAVETLSGDGMPLGVVPGDHWVEHVTTVRPGDRLVVFSDGLLDLLAPGDWVPQVAALARRHDRPETLLDEVRRWVATGAAIDDVTVIVLHRGAGVGPS